MSGIMCVTPSETIETPKDGVIKQKRVTQTCLLEKKGIVTALDYRPSNKSGLDCFEFEDLDKLFPSQNCDDFPTTLDVCWMVAKMLKLSAIPGWHGMLERLTCNEYCDISRVIQLPFIMAPPSEKDTVYTALMMAISEGDKINLNTIFVTFDLPLFMKAVNIVLSAPANLPLQRVVVRLGGFHLLMSFLGTIGYIMADSGLDQLLSVVYAENSVAHILNGHAYSRAIRAHMLASTAISHLIFKQIHLTLDEEVAIKNLLEDFADFPPCKQSVDGNDAVISITHKFKHEILKIEESGPTAKLWIQYIKMVTLIRRFIQAERTGDWKLHLSVVKMMIPYFIASGHLHYSKASYIYLQLMSTLPQRMDPEEYRKSANGYCTVRRNNKFCSGTWTDMVIEQTANREFKVLGGVIRRGFTDEVLNAYVVTKPAFSDIVESLEDFSGVDFFSSEQHIDARESRVKRDEVDVEKLLKWLETHDPFSSTTTVVVSVGSGVIGNDSINCHQAKEVGLQRLKLLVGHTFKDVKLKRCNNIRPLSAVNSSVKAYDRVINIDPLILYQRMLLKKEEDLSYYFTFEIAPFPLSLFTNTGMRKNAKSSLCTEFENIPEKDLKEKLERVTTFIIDGGYLLHTVKWGINTKVTYQDVCNKYLHFIKKKFRNPVVVFDGYSDPDSIKKCEQLRRYQLSAPQIKIKEDTTVCTNQERFLANECNKEQLIVMLTKTFQEAGIEVRQSTGDADGLIVKTAVQKSSSAIITQDTDIIVLLTALAPENSEILLIKPKKGCNGESVYSSIGLQNQHQGVKDYILLAHSFSGCDTTSAIYGKGKKQLFKLLEAESGLADHIHTFNKSNSSHEEVRKAGEAIFIHLYGSKDGSISLNELRFKLFQKSLKKSVARLECLPPTSDSAAQHSYRTYYQVQHWQGNRLSPEEWGWVRHNNKYLIPIRTTIDPAPETILKLISCSCKGTCVTTQCSCVKSGIKCTILCRFCESGHCTNKEQLSDRPKTSHDDDRGELTDNEELFDDNEFVDNEN